MRYETNDYSVPTEYGHRQVLIKAFVWEVVISCASEVIARHTRSYGREVIILWPPNGKPVLVTVSGVVTPGTSPLTSTTATVTDEYGQVQPSGNIVLRAGGSYSASSEESVGH